MFHARSTCSLSNLSVCLFPTDHFAFGKIVVGKKLLSVTYISSSIVSVKTKNAIVFFLNRPWEQLLDPETERSQILVTKLGDIKN